MSISPQYGSHICRKLAGFVKWLHTHFDSLWTRTRGLSSRDVRFQDPSPGQQGQVSQMWYPFPTRPIRTTGFVPTIFISRHGLTHTGAHTSSRLVQLQLSASLDTRVSSLPWPITGFLFSQTAPLSWLITLRLTSFTCLLSCPLWWPISGPPSTEMIWKWKSFSCIINLPSPALQQLSEHWFIEQSFLVGSFASSVKHLVSGYYKHTFKLLIQTWQTNLAKKTKKKLIYQWIGHHCYQIPTNG